MIVLSFNKERFSEEEKRRYAKAIGKIIPKLIKRNKFIKIPMDIVCLENRITFK